MCSINFYRKIIFFCCKKFFYTSRKIDLKNERFSRSKLGEKEKYIFNNENICKFTREKKISKVLKVVD